MFHYLATPYSKYPDGHEAAYFAALEQTGLLIAAGHMVFSPIVHSHPLVVAGHVTGTDHLAWLKVNHTMIAASCGVIVCKLATWFQSHGIQDEIAYANQLRKPVVFMEPGIIPDGL